MLQQQPKEIVARQANDGHNNSKQINPIKWSQWHVVTGRIASGERRVAEIKVYFCTRHNINNSIRYVQNLAEN